MAAQGRRVRVGIAQGGCWRASRVAVHQNTISGIAGPRLLQILEQQVASIILGEKRKVKHTTKNRAS